jgi:hypothetical protein
MTSSIIRAAVASSSIALALSSAAAAYIRAGLSSVVTPVISASANLVKVISLVSSAISSMTATAIVAKPKELASAVASQLLPAASMTVVMSFSAAASVASSVYVVLGRLIYLVLSVASALLSSSAIFARLAYSAAYVARLSAASSAYILMTFGSAVSMLSSAESVFSVILKPAIMRRAGSLYRSVTGLGKGIMRVGTRRSGGAVGEKR